MPVDPVVKPRVLDVSTADRRGSRPLDNNITAELWSVVKRRVLTRSSINYIIIPVKAVSFNVRTINGIIGLRARPLYAGTATRELCVENTSGTLNRRRMYVHVMCTLPYEILIDITFRRR